MRHSTRRRGTTAVEFAVTVGVLMMLILTTIDLGLLYLAQQALNMGVARAARHAIVNSSTNSNGSVASQFDAAVTPVLGAAQASRCVVLVSFSPASTPGGSVTVTATLLWHPFTSFDFMPSVTLESTASMVIQH